MLMTPRSNILLAATVVAGLVAVTSSAAHANLLVYEGFDVPGATVGQQWSTTSGSGATSVGFAPGSSWQVYTPTGSAPAADYTYQSNLAVPGLATGGGSVDMIGGLTYFARQLGVNLPSTIWGSYVINPIHDSSGQFAFQGLDFVASPTDRNSHDLFGVYAPAYGTGNYGGASGDLGGMGSGQYINSGSPITYGPAANATYVVLFTVSGIGSGKNVTGNDWVLTSGQYASMASQSGITGAALNSATLGTGNNDILERYSTTDGAAMSGFSVTNSDYLQVIGTHTNFDFGAVRIGTSLGDVTPVPEPSDIDLLFLGAAGCWLLPLCRRTVPSRW